LSGSSNFKFSFKPCYAHLSCGRPQETCKKNGSPTSPCLFGRQGKEKERVKGKKEERHAFLPILKGLKI